MVGKARQLCSDGARLLSNQVIDSLMLTNSTKAMHNKEGSTSGHSKCKELGFALAQRSW